MFEIKKLIVITGLNKCESNYIISQVKFISLWNWKLFTSNKNIIVEPMAQNQNMQINVVFYHWKMNYIYFKR